MNYDLAPIKIDDRSIQEIADLLRFVFPDAKKYSYDFIDWQYRKNPEGTIKGYNAFCDGKLVAHYAMMPITATLFGKEERGLLSLNTVTHPDHQGKKLFTTLADMSYRSAAKEGFGFVIGVANANSTPGFVSKLGFELLGPLSAKLGMGRTASAKNSKTEFSRKWNKEILEWRLHNPENKYKIKNNMVWSKTDKTGIKVMLSDVTGIADLPDNSVALGFRPLSLLIGTDVNVKGGFYFDIPERMKPSPLNLIFKDLTPGNRKLNINKVRFNALDFDAY